MLVLVALAREEVAEAALAAPQQGGARWKQEAAVEEQRAWKLVVEEAGRLLEPAVHERERERAAEERGQTAFETMEVGWAASSQWAGAAWAFRLCSRPLTRAATRGHAGRRGPVELLAARGAPRGEGLEAWGQLLAAVWVLRRDLIRDLRGMAHGLDPRPS